MKQSENQDSNMVTFLADRIVIENKPRIVLCASVFYFRIPSHEWKDRLEKVKAAGYNCIDIYFPWNYHELEEDDWNFSGEKDVIYFLTLARELELWVIARPGPYICSEWDMGSLPAYLLTKENLILRDYNEVYLSYVRKWYEKIMPIIANYQLGKQGTVIAVQIENELDFYDCKQVEPYIQTLRNYAIELGINVPIVVCAGQCDIKGAGGLVDGVIPTINLYPEMSEISLEDKINHYLETFREMDLPLCITETSTLHFILRRELIAGAKFIAPYNQVSGTDFGFTTSVNNWGSPMTYMTHDYQLNGMINPQGEVSKEYDEAYLFSGLIKCFEEEISTSVSQMEQELNISADCKLSSGIHRTLRCNNGGKFAAIANVDEKVGYINFLYNEKNRPVYTSFEVNPLECPIIPFELPLSNRDTFDLGCKIAYSTAEICYSEFAFDTLNLLLHSNHQAEIALINQNIVDIMVENMQYETEGTLVILYKENKQQDGNVVVTLNNGKKIHLYITSRANAVQGLKTKVFPWNNQENKVNELSTNMSVNKSESKVIEFHELKLKQHSLPDMGKGLSGNHSNKLNQCNNMEDMGYYRGYGWYEGNVNLYDKERALGYMIYNGMDIIHLYKDNCYLKTIIGDGTHKFIKEPHILNESSLKLGVRCEIWGHSNFSDSRLPAMDIRSKKGIKGLALITNITDITEYWCYCKDELPSECVTLISEKDKYNSIIKFTAYNNPEQPQKGIYKRKIKLSPNCNAMVLELKGFKSFGKVFVNGDYVQDIQPYNAAVSLDEYCNKREIELAIYLEQKTIQESKDSVVILYEGRQISDINCHGADERAILEYTTLIDDKKYEDLTMLSNVNLEPGEVTIICADFEITKQQEMGLKLLLKGKNVKVLAQLNCKMIGRLWLPSDIRPEFRGGDDSILYLPKSYLKESNELILLIEALEDEPVLDGIQFIGVE